MKGNNDEYKNSLCVQENTLPKCPVQYSEI